MNTGGPAFPSQHDDDIGYPAKGMTQRDYFAAKAMLFYFDGPDAKVISKNPDAVARWCYIMADAMLKARGMTTLCDDSASENTKAAYQRGYLDGMAKPCIECADRQWVGLTQDEFREFATTYEYGTGGLIRAIEAKLKEKNT